MDDARKVFEGSLAYPTLEANFEVRRRKRASNFCVEDLVFVVEFKRGGQGGNLPLLSVMRTVDKVLIQVIQKLKDYFDETQKRYCFFSCSVDSMTSSIYSGMRNLYDESEEDLASAVLRPLFVYLCSKTEANLDSNLEIKCCVCSLEHSTQIDKKKGVKAL